MRTSVTQFKGSVSGKYAFPQSTQYGVIQNVNLAGYLNSLTAKGVTLPTSFVEAFVTFFDSGENEGWLDRLLYVMPFCGTTANTSAIATPLIAKIGEKEDATIVKTGDATYVGELSDFTDMAVVSGSNIKGIKQHSETTKALLLQLTNMDVFAKASPLYGWNFCGDFSNVGVTTGIGLRIAGARPIDTGGTSRKSQRVSIYAGNNNTEQSMYGLSSYGGITDTTLSNFNYWSNLFEIPGTRFRTRTILGDIAGDVFISVSNYHDMSALPTSVGDSASTERFAVTRELTNQDYPVVGGKTADFTLTWLAVTDGMFTTASELQYRTALGNLLTALCKR